MKDDRLYLGHILEAADRIVSYGERGEEAFRRDRMIQDAIVRNLQVMGEAVKKVSPETRLVAGMRDRVVHDYFGVSLDIVWDVVSNHVPPLRERLKRIRGG